MKFEQLLQVYWARGFLFGGKIWDFDQSFDDLTSILPSFATKSKLTIIKRFELSNYVRDKDLILTTAPNNFKKGLNTYFSRVTSVNASPQELTRYCLIRLYLTKSFRGRAQALGKPCRGQRTRTNAWGAYKYNTTLRSFIATVKKKTFKTIVPVVINYKKLKRKERKPVRRFNKKPIAPKKKSAWF